MDNKIKAKLIAMMFRKKKGEKEKPQETLKSHIEELRKQGQFKK